MSTGGPEETNSQNEIESERAKFKTLAIINKAGTKVGPDRLASPGWINSDRLGSPRIMKKHKIK